MIKIHRDVWWFLSVVVIATAVLERLENGTAGWFSLAVIPAALYLCASLFWVVERKQVDLQTFLRYNTCVIYGECDENN